MTDELVVVGIGLDTSKLASGAQQATQVLRQVTDQGKATEASFKGIDAELARNAQAFQQQAVSAKTAQGALQEFTTRAAAAGDNVKQLEQAVKQGEQAFKRLGVTLDGRILDKFGNDSGAAVQSLKELGNELSVEQQRLRELQSSAGQAGQSLSNMGSAVSVATGILGAFGVALSLRAVVKFGEDVIDAGVKLDKFQLGFQTFTGSAAAASRELQFTSQVAKQYGQDLDKTREVFLGLTSSMQAGHYTQQQTRDLFTGVTQAAVASGKDMQAVGTFFQAFTRAIETGSITARDFQGVFRQIPAIFDALARSQGVSNESLIELTKNTGLYTRDVIPPLVDYLKNRFGPAAEEAGAKAGASISRMSTAWKEFEQALFSSKLVKTFSDIAASAVEAATALTKTQGYLSGGTGTLTTGTAGSINSRAQFRDLFQQSGKQYGVDPILLEAIAVGEHSGQRATSSAGAQGLMQLMPANQRAFGVTDPFDARQNIGGAAQFLHQLMVQFSGDVSKVVAAYNAGPNGNFNNPETAAYVPRVLDAYGRLRAQASGTGYTPPVDPSAAGAGSAAVSAAVAQAGTSGSGEAGLTKLRDDVVARNLKEIADGLAAITSQAQYMPKAWDASSARLTVLNDGLTKLAQNINARPGAGALDKGLSGQIDQYRSLADSIKAEQEAKQQALQAQQTIDAYAKQTEAKQTAALEQLRGLATQYTELPGARDIDRASILYWTAAQNAANKEQADAYIGAIQLGAALKDKAQQAKEDAKLTEAQGEAYFKAYNALTRYQEQLGLTSAGNKITSEARQYTAAQSALGPLLGTPEGDNAQKIIDTFKGLADKATPEMKKLKSVSDDLAQSFIGNFEKMASGGKVSFSQMADSIIADMIRISLQQTVAPWLSQLFQTGLSAANAYFGGVGGSTSAAGVTTLGDTFSAGSGAVSIGGTAGDFALAGARADGGPFDAGKPYLVGEHGPEMAVFPNSGYIVPNEQLASSGAGNGKGGNEVHLHGPLVQVNTPDANSFRRSQGEIQGTALRTLQSFTRNN